MPSARQGNDAVDHAAPRRGQKNQREDHADGLRPVRQRRVVQVVRLSVAGLSASAALGFSLRKGSLIAGNG